MILAKFEHLVGNSKIVVTMRQCACTSIIKQHAKIDGLARLIQEYAAEFSGKRISDWLLRNGSITIAQYCTFSVEYELPSGTIMFGNSITNDKDIVCTPDNAVYYLQTLSSLPEKAARGWADTAAAECVKFTNEIGRWLSIEVPPQCHFFDDHA